MTTGSAIHLAVKDPGGGSGAIVQVPVRYKFTTQGVALGRVLFRPWSEFAGYRSSEKGLAIVGKGTNGSFWVRATGDRQQAALVQTARRLPALSAATS